MLAALLAFVPFAVSMSATPGPNNVMLTSSGATFGFRRTLPHMLGIVVGFPVMLALVGVGFGGVLARYPEIHAVLRVLGALYLAYLAYRIATAGRPDPGSSQAPARPMTFVSAALFQWVNPKAWIIAATAIATFAGPRGAVAHQAAFEALVFALVSFPCVALWAAAGAGAGRFLRRDPTLRAFNLTMALFLAASIVPMVREL